LVATTVGLAVRGYVAFASTFAVFFSRAFDEECIFAGIPINVTLLFSADQYQSAAEAYLRGVERRVDAALNPAVHSEASVFISRWDRAVDDPVPAPLQDHLGIAVAQQAYRGYTGIC
jgi:transaldolase